MASSLAYPPRRLASQADMVTPTAADRAVTPLVTQNHPGVAKGWIVFSLLGGFMTVVVSHNATAVRNGTGDATITWTTGFSGFYCPVCWGDISLSVHTNTGWINQKGISATTLQLQCVNSLGAATDWEVVCAVAWGPQ